MVIGTFQEDFRWWTICGKLWRRRWSGGLSVAAILGPGGPSMATKISIDGPGGPILGGPILGGRIGGVTDPNIMGFKYSVTGHMHTA